METNFNEGISDDVLKGSFLALKQLQTKSKKGGKVGKKAPLPVATEEEKAPRSQLYADFKALNKLDDNGTIKLDTRVPISRLMYATYDEIFARKRKKKRFTSDDKPDHPFFGKNAVLAENFTLSETNGPSSHHQEIIEGMEIEGLIHKHNYNMNPVGNARAISFGIKTPKAIIVADGNQERKSRSGVRISEELLESLQRPIVSSDDED